MMHLFSKPTTILAATAILLSFTACEQADVAPDATMSAQNEQAAHQSKSFNLNKTYTVNFSELNNSGVNGTAMLTLMGEELMVHIQASGLAPNELHPQHIHGFTDSKKNAICPDMDADTDGDGLIELTEGAPYYGPVLLTLAPLPTAPNGTINFRETYDMTSALRPLQNRVIVLHGAYVLDGEIVPKGTPGATYDATLPVACGMIMNGNSMMKGKK